MIAAARCNCSDPVTYYRPEMLAYWCRNCGNLYKTREEEMFPTRPERPDRIDEIKAERQKVYGDPRENHKGIAQMWACLLQPHAEAIAKMEPLPEHTVAMMMAALKLNRMRRVFHQDNYDDLTAYISFAREWQKDHDSKTN